MLLLRGILFSLFLLSVFSFSIDRADRKIRIDGHIVRSVSTLAVRQGSGRFVVPILKGRENSLAWIEAVIAGKSTQLKKDKQDAEGAEYSFPLTVKKGETVEVKIKEVYIDALSPLPDEITQSEHQYVKFIDNHFLWTPYTVESQKTEIKLTSSAIESHSQEQPTVAKGDTISYGEYGPKEAFARSRLSVHFKNDNPFVTSDSVLKEIEVSHWGSNVAVTEEYQLHNTGASLKGGFSRFEYQRSGMAYTTMPVIQNLKGKLPWGAADIYYRDAIGNVSTSTLHDEFPETRVELVPRFPVFGGWKDNFYYGYNLPASKYISRSTTDPSQYVLNMSFASPFKEMAIRTLVVRIILPEGASNVETSVPFPVDSVTSSGLRYTYLDHLGRPVIEITKHNVVSEHNKIFSVNYHFASSNMIREVLQLFTAFFAFFVVCIIYIRLDLSIRKKSE